MEKPKLNHKERLRFIIDGREFHMMVTPEAYEKFGDLPSTQTPAIVEEIRRFEYRSLQHEIREWRIQTERELAAYERHEEAQTRASMIFST